MADRAEMMREDAANCAERHSAYDGDDASKIAAAIRALPLPPEPERELDVPLPWGGTGRMYVRLHTSEPERTAEEWVALLDSAQRIAPRIARGWSGARSSDDRFFVDGKGAAWVWRVRDHCYFAVSGDEKTYECATLDEAKSAADARLLAAGVLLVGGPHRPATP